MPRAFTETELVLATHNKGKIVEIADLLSPYVENFVTAIDLDLSEPEETGLTFAANAELKALAAAQESGKVALADDSGLAVNALDGAPGIYSARWAGPDRDFGLAMQKVHDELGAKPDRSAAFICALTLGWPDGHTETFEGRIDGEIVWPPRGDRGFGYDPIFVPDGDELAFGEMEPTAKHAMSHRTQAFKMMVAGCFVTNRQTA